MYSTQKIPDEFSLLANSKSSEIYVGIDGAPIRVYTERGMGT